MRNGGKKERGGFTDASYNCKIICETKCLEIDINLL